MVARMRPVAAVLLVAWVAAGLLLTLQPAHPLPGQVVTDNGVPFLTIGIYLDNLDSPFWVRQLLGNLALLLPVGVLGPVVVPALRRWWLVLLVALAISAGIEVAQLFIPDRSADVDDVIVNVAGAMLGFVVFHVGSLFRRPTPVGT
jgi:glycopeptide antibiotics resistance protein